jgi:hypothetical protein
VDGGSMSDKGVSRWREWVRSSPVAAFFVLTFLISWSIWGAARALLPGASWGLRIAVHTVGLFGPTAAAVIISGWLYGRQGVGDLLMRIARWRVGMGWHLFALFSALAVGLGAIGVHALVGAPPRLRICTSCSLRSPRPVCPRYPGSSIKRTAIGAPARAAPLSSATSRPRRCVLAP